LRPGAAGAAGRDCKGFPASLESRASRSLSDSTAKPRIALGADHAGYHIKETIKKLLSEAGYAVDDVGTSSEESVDYPDFARAVAERVAGGKSDFGVLACGTGLGMAIAANKVAGIRAATAHDAMTARLAREHNDANVLALGARVLDNARAIEVVRAFLAAKFAGGRHQRRVDKITEMDQARVKG
jgi:ribose 5-phosphate isomerase B